MNIKNMYVAILASSNWIEIELGPDIASTVIWNNLIFTNKKISLY